MEAGYSSATGTNQSERANKSADSRAGISLKGKHSQQSGAMTELGLVIQSKTQK